MVKKKSGNTQRSWLRFLMIMGGLIAVVLGLLGIFVPILPTTPFLLLASFLLVRSSPKAHNWLLNNKLFGFYVRGYIYHRAVSRGVKIFTLLFLWGTITISCFLIKGMIWVQILLIIIAIAVSIHVLTLQNLNKNI